MSLVYRRFLAISLPTVAAFLSILWLRNRRKGRRLLADSSVPDCLLNKAEEESNSKADHIDCSNIEDTLTSDIEVGELVSSGVSELCKENIESSVFSSKSSELLDCPIIQAGKEDTIGSEVLGISEPEEENYCSSEELEEVEIEEIAAELDLIERPAECLETPAVLLDLIETSAKVVNFIEPPVEVVDLVKSPVEVVDLIEPSVKVVDSIEPLVEVAKEDTVVNCSIIPSKSEGVTKEIEMKKEAEQIKEPINNIDLDKMKETGQLADKLASLELDQMKIDERKSGSERDSANHSPSEIMLASPSISNFSDAHSEVSLFDHGIYLFLPSET